MTCGRCYDTGLASDGARMIPCPMCPPPTTLAMVLASVASAVIVLAVLVLLLVAWFGDLQSVPLIGK